MSPRDTAIVFGVILFALNFMAACAFGVYGYSKKEEYQAYETMPDPGIEGLKDCKSFRIVDGHSKIYVLRCPNSKVSTRETVSEPKHSDVKTYSNTNEE